MRFFSTLTCYSPINYLYTHFFLYFLPFTHTNSSTHIFFFYINTCVNIYKNIHINRLWQVHRWRSYVLYFQITFFFIYTEYLYIYSTFFTMLVRLFTLLSSIYFLRNSFSWLFSLDIFVLFVLFFLYFFNVYKFCTLKNKLLFSHFSFVYFLTFYVLLILFVLYIYI